MITESILTSVKKMLGIEKEYEHFDPELVMHINSVFSTLNQLGVGPDKTFSITGDKEKWDDFCSDKTFQNVKTYIYLRLRLIWDPPSNSFAVNSFEKQIQELEWRLNVQAENAIEDETVQPEEPDEENKPTTITDIFVKPEDGKLPEVGEPNKIYIIPADIDDLENAYNEYYWNPEIKMFELIGPAMEEMSKEEFDNMWNSFFKGE